VSKGDRFTLNKMMLLALLGSLLALTSPAPAEVPIMPYEEVRAGMKGTGRTVFEGTRIETFDVEILGKLPDIGPDKDLIIARCSGGPLAESGILAGMSGSPVTIDGRLIGALSYSWSFSTEPIAGITPIEEMLEVAGLDSPGPARRGSSLQIDADRLAALRSPERLAAFVADELRPLLARPAGALPIQLPLSISGIGAYGLAGVQPFFADSGLMPMQSGSSGSSAAPAPAAEPGSAIGLKLVRGDIEMTATGTVTWVEGDRILALGHPLFSLGAVDLPMTGATVEVLLPSLMRSARLAVPLAEIGALRQDRASGVFGRLGATPRMIPVRLKMTEPAGPERVYSFDIADDPLLSPLLLYAALNGILSSRERSFGSATIRLQEGSVIKMADGVDVELDNIFSGMSAREYGTGIAAYILHLLMNNAWTEPRIAGINLIFEYDETPRSATIHRIALDRYRARPGETVQATIVLSPYRGGDQILTSKIEIPEETPPGRLSLQVGSAVAVSRAETHEGPLLPRDLDQLIDLINQLRRNDSIYIVASSEDSGVLLEGARLPNLPPSAAAILSFSGSRGNLTPIPRRRVMEEAISTDYAVEGSARIELEVEAP
jgi:hypothetical protein